MFTFGIDPNARVEIGGEKFAPGFFVWNSELGRRSVGVQAICETTPYGTLSRLPVETPIREVHPVTSTDCCSRRVRPEQLGDSRLVGLFAPQTGLACLETLADSFDDRPVFERDRLHVRRVALRV